MRSCSGTADATRADEEEEEETAAEEEAVPRPAPGRARSAVVPTADGTRPSRGIEACATYPSARAFVFGGRELASGAERRGGPGRGPGRGREAGGTRAARTAATSPRTAARCCGHAPQREGPHPRSLGHDF